MDLPDDPKWGVNFFCLACGAVSVRPCAWLKRTYGVTRLDEVGRRARCLTYHKGVRCGGRARVEFRDITPPPPPTVSAPTHWYLRPDVWKRRRPTDRDEHKLHPDPAPPVKRP